MMCAEHLSARAVKPTISSAGTRYPKIANHDYKPCPFCGGNAVTRQERYTPYQKIFIQTGVIERPEDRVVTECPKYPPIGGMLEIEKRLPTVNDGWLVECEKCGARGPHEYTDPIQSRDEALRLWNERSEEAREFLSYTLEGVGMSTVVDYMTKRRDGI